MSEEAAAPAAEATSAAETVAAAAEAEANAVPAWAEGLDDDSRSFIANKGWDKADNPVGEMLKSYRNTERLRGVNADQLVRIPEAGNEEQQAEWRARLGVPETAEGYGLEGGQVAGQDFDASVVAGLAHSIGATPEQAQALNAGVTAFLEQTMQEQHDAQNARLSAEKVDLDKAWGPELEANTLTAQKGFAALGYEAEVIDALESALGYRATMELGLKFGQYVAEPQRGDTDPHVTNQPYGISTEQARGMADKRLELANRIAKGDKSAAAELKRLNDIAFHS